MQGSGAKGCAPCAALARFLDVPGGIGVEEALLRAKENVEALRPQSMEAIDASMDAISRLRLSEVGEPSAAARNLIHREATTIASLAGTVGLGGLGAAARQFYEYIDLLKESRSWNEEGVSLHFNALRCLRNENGGSDCARVLEGLKLLAFHTAARRESVKTVGGQH